MWASVESGNVTEVYTRPKSLIIGDVRYPRNIFELWTEAELQAINIYTCIVDKRNWKDSDYYQNTAATYAYKATVTIDGTLKINSLSGSIHQIGAKVQGLPSCNGWDFWHFKNKKSSTLLDEIRGNYRTKKIN